MGKNQPANAGDAGSIPGVGKIPWRRKRQPAPVSCLENPMGRGAWRAIVHGVAKSQTWLSDGTHTHGTHLLYVRHLKKCLKSSLILLQCCFCFICWPFGYESCRLPAPRPGKEPVPAVLEGKVLTTGPPRKFLCYVLLGPGHLNKIAQKKFFFNANSVCYILFFFKLFISYWGIAS